MEEISSTIKSALSEKLADSLSGEIPAATERVLHGELFLPGKVTVVVGMRRVGKTTLLHQLRRTALAEGLPRTHLPYINFEDERLEGLPASRLGFLVDELERALSSEPSAQPRLWCLDELQLVPGWEKFVRRLLDSGTARIAITGSSAALLSREMATSLRGRAWTVPLFPFSFGEHLDHLGIERPPHGTPLPAATQAKLERQFCEWLLVGGFPEVQGHPLAVRNQILQDYVDVAMLRDVVERHDVSNVGALRWMVRQLLGNSGAFFSIEKFHATLKSQGHSVSRDTLHLLLGYLEDCYLVRLVALETTSERQRMVNPRKAYASDPGLIPLFDRSGKQNLGHALENAVLVELERRHCTVTYLKTPSGAEVDFVARHPDGSVELVQACVDASAPETAAREVGALVEGKVLFPRARRVLLSLNRDGYPEKVPKGIEVLSAWDWMLEG
jgi:predicted AAA+ superfamily ATPase